MPKVLSHKAWRLPQLARKIVAGLFVVLSITYAVRSALVTAYVEPNVQAAATIWKEHPDVLATRSRLAIAEAAAQNKPGLLKASEHLEALAERAPLSPEPFLAAGALAVSEGQYNKAEQLLLAARTRDPRSTATRYLLADLYWRENRVGPSLQELAAVRRLVPTLSTALVAGLAGYVSREGPTPQIREILRADSQLQSSLLSTLASDHANAELILALVGSQGGSETNAPWVQQLSASLIQAGEFRKAHKLWLKFASAADTRAPLWVFARSASSSPFMWQFTETSAGSAVPAGGQLEVFYSGRESINFASKLVLLPPGPYAISMLVSGTPPSSESIRWSVTCLPSDDKVADIPMIKSGRVNAQFRIPQACVAQRFELRGFAQTSPETGSFFISELGVTRGKTR